MPPPKTTYDFTLLFDIEELDNKRKTVQDRLGEIPRQREELSAEVARIDRSLRDKEQAIAAKEKLLSSSELDLKTSQSQEGEKRVKLNNVKTQKEYDAMKIEIENTIASRGKLEENILMLMDEVTDLRNFLKREKHLGEEKKKECNKRLEELAADEKLRQGELQGLDEQAKGRVDQMPEDILREYKRLRNTFPSGSMLSKLVSGENNTYLCTACNSPVATQVVIDVKRSLAVHHCQFCKRLLHPN